MNKCKNKNCDNYHKIWDKMRNAKNAKNDKCKKFEKFNETRNPIYRN